MPDVPVARIFHAIGVVPCSFEGTWAGALPPLGVQPLNDLLDRLSGLTLETLRGKKPPGR